MTKEGRRGGGEVQGKRRERERKRPLALLNEARGGMGMLL
jgi:hypothetical protein